MPGTEASALSNRRSAAPPNKPSSGRSATSSAKRSAERSADEVQRSESVPDRSAREVHAALTAALERLREAEESAVLNFAEILRRKLFRELGHSSIHAYAEHELGFSRSKTFQFIQLAEALGKLPGLRAAIEHGELPWTKALSVARVATPRSEQRWLREAKSSSRRDLESKVRQSRARAGRDPAQQNLLPGEGAQRGQLSNAPGQGALTLKVNEQEASQPEASALPAAPVSLGLRFSPEQHARLQALLERLRKRGRRESREELFLEGLALLADAESESSRLDSASPYQIVIYKCEVCGGASLPEGRLLAPAVAEAAQCDARLQRSGEPNRATIPPRVRRAVLIRDSHRCRMPGCRHTRFLEVHHIRPRTAGGGNRAENLITLCSACHRLIHEQPEFLDLLRVEGREREALPRPD